MRFLIPLVISLFWHVCVYSQLRQVSVDIYDEDNHAVKLSFYSPAEGYVAFTKYLGYTTDSARTFTKKYITMSNVNYNGYSVNLTFGFTTSGIKAFNKDTLVVYGHYGFVPAILYSADAGNTFKLVYHSQYNTTQFTDGITDLCFPVNHLTGFAVESNRIIKTIDGGKTWYTIRNDPNGFYDFIVGIDNSQIMAGSRSHLSNKIVKTTNGGNTWLQMVVPPGQIGDISFISSSKGWLSISDNGAGKLYFTADAGASWSLKNDPTLENFGGSRLTFIDDSTGYVKGGLFSIFKTTDSGKIWERIPRDNNFEYFFFSHEDLQVISPTQFWAAGSHGLIELSTNAGGIPIPASLFKIDTVGLYVSNTVQLKNFSKTGDQYTWFKNGSLISTEYHASYQHVPGELKDTIQLVVSRNGRSDTSLRYQFFSPLPAGPMPYTGWVNNTTNIQDDLLDVRFYGEKGAVIGRNGVYFTTTGAENAGGWQRYVISNNPSDSSLFARCVFRQFAGNDKSAIFYLVGNDTVNNKAVIFRINLDAGHTLIYQGAQGSRLNSILYYKFANCIYAVGDQGLFVYNQWNQSGATASVVAGNKNLKNIFKRSGQQPDWQIAIFADSTLFLGHYDSQMNFFKALASHPLNQNIRQGVGYNGITAIGKDKIYLYSNGPSLYSDSIARIKPIGVTFNSITASVSPHENFIATSYGIYKVISGGGNPSTIEYQPTSGRNFINRIWFKEEPGFDTAFAVGKNGLLLKTMNQGGPTIPYAEITTGAACFGSPTTLSGVKGSATGCNWLIDDIPVSTQCNNTATINFSSPGLHTIRYIVSNPYGLADTADRVVRVVDPPAINLAYSIADSILCKSEPVFITLTNAQPDFEYRLMDSTGASYGSVVASSSGVLQFQSMPISRTANYFFRVTSIFGGCMKDFTQKIFIRVEHTRSRFAANLINITPGQTVDFFSRSVEAAEYKWTFNQDASSISSIQSAPQDISYSSSGQKTLTLISLSANGCSDTLTSDAVFVYVKPVPDDVCYVATIDSSGLHGQGYRHLMATPDNGYVVSGTNSGPLVRSRYGQAMQLSSKAASFLAKYSTNGVLEWLNYTTSGAIMTSATDDQGNYYIGGYMNFRSYYHFSNGDSMQIAALPGDLALSFGYKLGGYILKIDPSGNYLWHVVLGDNSSMSSGLPVSGGLITNIRVKNNSIVVAGDFMAKLSYYHDGVEQQLYQFQNTGFPNDMRREFLLKLDSDGALQWNLYIHNGGINEPHNLADVDIDESGNVFIAGSFGGNTLLSDAGNTNVITLNSTSGNQGGYLFKFDPSGHLLWKVTMENLVAFKDISLAALAVDENGNCYVTGGVTSLTANDQFQVINGDGSVKNLSLSAYHFLKFDSDGMLLWSAGSRYSYYGGGTNIHIDGEKIFVTGTLANNGEFSSEFLMLSADGSMVNLPIHESEFFIAGYDTSGLLQSVVKSKVMDGFLTPGYLATDDDHNFILGGNAHVPGPSASVFDLPFTVGYAGDIFFAKLNPDLCQPASTIVANAGPDKTVCSGGTTQIGTPNAGNNFWMSSQPGFTSTSAIPFVSPNVTTHFYLAVIDPSGRITRDTVTIFITGPIAYAGENRAICKGVSVVLGNSDNGDNYSWTSVPSGFTSSQATPSVIPSVSTTYFFKATNPASSCVGYDTVTVTVYDVPWADAGPDQTICYGSTMGAMIGYDHTPGYQYLWTPTPDWSDATDPYPIVNPTSITTYALAVTNPANGCVGRDTVVVTPAQVLETPVIFASGPLTFCNGGSVVLSSSSPTGNQWFLDGVMLPDEVEQDLLVVSSGNYTVHYMDGFCTSYHSAPVTVVVTNPANLPAITLSGSSTICTGNSVTLTSTQADGYQWFRDGLAINGAVSQTYIASTGGSYTVVTTGAGGCVAESTPVGIIVSAVPTTPVITHSGPLSFCIGGNVLLSTISPGALQWYRNDVLIPGAISANYQATQAGSYSVSTTQNGCSAHSGPVVISVNDLPVAPTISAAGSTNFCEGGTVVLTSSWDNVSQWFRDGVLINGATSQHYTATVSGSYTVVSMINNCVSPGSAVTVVQVMPLPSKPVITISGSTGICDGQAVQMISSAVSGNQWYRDGVIIPGATAQTYSANQAGNYTVITTKANCSSLPSVAISLTSLTSPQTPVITALGSLGICQGDSVRLSSSALSGNQWYRNDEIILGAVSKNYFAKLQGNYTVKVTEGACTSSISAAKQVVVGSVPSTPVISQSGNLLTSSAATGNQWFLNGAIIPGATAQTFQFLSAGNYTVVVTINGCSSAASNSLNVVPTSINSPALDARLTISPNPVNDILSVKYSGPNAIFTMFIYDDLGRQVYKRSGLVQSWETNMQEYAAGTYIVMILNNRTNEQVQRKIVKM